MNRKLLMTPGPTCISEDVRREMSLPITNPDLDNDFFELYKNTCELLQNIMQTENEVLILSGEGILGLEAACASLIEEGDRVLIISNGIFGEGFGDFVKLYGGKCVYYEQDYRTPINSTDLRKFLSKDQNFKLATIVHCETPSGLINPIESICPLLNEYGIITIVDAVSSIGGIPIETDEWKIDILLGGSQKCLSAPPGLTFLSLSNQAKKIIKEREQPIRSYYCNLSIWDQWYEKKWFPYTQPINLIFALNKACINFYNDDKVFSRHREQAKKVRDFLLNVGLELYPTSGYSDTVTAFLVPRELDEKNFRKELWEKNGILIAGAFGPLKGKVLRIGHMGENCYEDKIDYTLKCIESHLR